MAIKLLDTLKGKLIVSCQAEGDDPFNSPEGIAMFALAAKIGGAAAVRSEGMTNIEAIQSCCDLPVIGLIKSKFDDGSVRITGSFKEVENLLKIGCDIVSVDGTDRIRDGLSGADFIGQIKKRYDCIIMADISTYEEALACSLAGADCISTTLSGYTPNTATISREPDFNLVQYLVSRLSIPVIAEGRINTPQMAKIMIDIGAWAIVVGTAISRPRIITQWFVEAIKDI